MKPINSFTKNKSGWWKHETNEADPVISKSDMTGSASLRFWALLQIQVMIIIMMCDAASSQYSQQTSRQQAEDPIHSRSSQTPRESRTTDFGSGDSLTWGSILWESTLKKSALRMCIALCHHYIRAWPFLKISHLCKAGRESTPRPRREVWIWEGPLQGGRWYIVYYHHECWARLMSATNGGA